MKPLIILDTNVLISALMYPNSPSSQAVTAAFRYFQPIVSSTTWNEFERVSGRKKFERFYNAEERASFLFMLAQSVHMVEITVTTTDCRDQKDNQFLDLALSTACQVLVSGDTDLRTMNPYHGISIISPAEFLEMLSAP
jgi:putative PIN family toxin of toxin-antitoxin system